MIRQASSLLALVLVAGCNQTMSEINRPPALSPVGSGVVIEPASLAHYPKEPASPVRRFSLWDDRQSKLFTDPRALSVGDILTVLISINDRAKFKNESERSRNSTRDLSLGGSFDFDGVTGDAKAGFDIGSGTKSVGNGQTARSEALDLSIAAIVTDVLPNGNLVIQGSQEVRVNAELRVLTIGGIVRPTDIGPDNVVSWERIAEARISYGGRGRLSEVQQPPYGQQVLDLVLPF
jgi:flagellar L-ring protein precursor FlgH